MHKCQNLSPSIFILLLIISKCNTYFFRCVTSFKDKTSRLLNFRVLKNIITHISAFVIPTFSHSSGRIYALQSQSITSRLIWFIKPNAQKIFCGGGGEKRWCFSVWLVTLFFFLYLHLHLFLFLFLYLYLILWCDKGVTFCDCRVT